MVLVLTDAALTAIASARIGGPKVSVTQFSIGVTSGVVTSALTSVPSQVYGLTPINSAFLADTNSAQFECIVPELIGTFDFNVLGLFDNSGVLIAIAKADNFITKIATNLPSVIGNRIVLRAQLAITNADAVLNFTLNVLSNANLNFVTSVKDLSGLASVGLYKTYRVLSMSDGYSSIATSNGSTWNYSRFNPLFVGSSASTAADLTHVVGSTTNPFKSYHVGSILEFITGPNAGSIREITAVNTVTNIATIVAVGTIPVSGNSFLLSGKDKVHLNKSLVYADDSGYKVDDSNLTYDDANKRLALRVATPLAGFHQLGGGLKLESLTTPTGPTVNVVGTPGTTTYSYFILAEDYEGNRTTLSNVGITNLGNATLTGSNLNRITWASISGAKQYRVFKTDSSTLLGVTTSTTLDDIGQATSAYVSPTRNETADILASGKVIAGQDPSDPTDLVTLQYLQSLIASLIGPGSMKMWPIASVPTGWLVCDGTAVSRTTYADLFSVLGTVFGIGNGTTTFNLPDFKGRSPIGLGLSDAANASNTYTLGQKTGEEKHIQTLAELATHGHSYNTAFNPVGGAGGSDLRNNWSTFQTGTAGSSQAANIVHPVTAINIIIKT